MRYEKSCGAVVYTTIGGKRKYVIIESLAGNHGFPKGHTESGETEKETALREIREETGLRPELIEGFRTEDEYPLPRKPNVTKRIVYFLARYEDQRITPLKTELLSARLLSFDEAMRIFEFENCRRILREAEDFLERMTRSPETPVMK